MGMIEQKFIVSPFSILDTKQGYWQNRKRFWLNKGIRSEIGRDAACLPSGFDETKYGKKMSQSTSIFDPVLCELMYKWFCIDNGKILDPFAGGSVRGIVASLLDYNYTGIDLSKTQINANIEQTKTICKDTAPIYINGDSNIELDNLENEKYDLIFSCPPYFNLEVYSNENGELSAMNYNNFLIAYNNIIKKSLTKLKNNSFAIFVVGDVRDKQGFYVNFVEDTVKLFEKNGAKKYNELILVNAIGSLPIRITKQFNGGRKIGKMHQNILVFYKGDPKNIKNKFDAFIYKTQQTSLSDYYE